MHLSITDIYAFLSFFGTDVYSIEGEKKRGGGGSARGADNRGIVSGSIAGPALVVEEDDGVGMVEMEGEPEDASGQARAAADDSFLVAIDEVFPGGSMVVEGVEEDFLARFGAQKASVRLAHLRLRQESGKRQRYRPRNVSRS